LAIVSLIALLVALAFVALLSLQPWAVSVVAPQLSVAPGLGAALDDAVALPPGNRLAVAPARPAAVAAAGGRRLAANVATAGAEGSRPRLGVAAARAVARPPGDDGAESRPEQPPAPESPPASPSPPSPAPAAVPVATPAPSPAPEVATAPPTRVASSHGKPPAGPTTAGMGPVDGEAAEAVDIHEGKEYAFTFSFGIQPDVYLPPGSENLIVQIQGEESESPRFGLQLWDDGSGSGRGLWASGDAMGGERFLAPVAEGIWHEATVYLRASSKGDGFYLLLLDGEPIDARAWVSLIDPGESAARIEVGLFREGERVVGASGAIFGPFRLG
jgi:hypothetical protein